MAKLLRKTVPNLTTPNVNCPLDGMVFIEIPCPFYSDIYGVIMHLNDTHRISREEIADWLDSLDVDLSFPTP